MSVYKVDKYNQRYQYVTSKYYKSLVVGGGALKILGALGYITANCIDLEEIDIFVGTSAGAILCFLLIFFKSPLKVLKRFIAYNFDFKCSESSNGIFSMRENIERVTGNCTWSFLDLYRITGKDLRVVTTNVSRGCVEVFDKKNHPSFSVIRALEMSSCIPLLFSPMREGECLYADGGLLDNFPIGVGVEPILAIVPKNSEYSKDKNIYYNNPRITIVFLRDDTDGVYPILSASKEAKMDLFFAGYQRGRKKSF